MRQWSRALCATGAALVWPLLGVTPAAAARTPRVHALVGARVCPRPGTMLERSTVVVRDGVVTAVGDVQVPPDARVWDVRGRTVYAGLIEPYLDLETGKKETGDPARRLAEEPARAAAVDSAGVRHPNPRVRAEERLAVRLALETETVEALRQAGFAAAHVVPSQGIFRGRSAVVGLRPGSAREQLLRADVAQIVAFESGSWEDRNPAYPGSLMGAVALVRQTLLDARWAREARRAYDAAPAGVERPATNLAIEALGEVLPPSPSAPVWLLTQDVLGTLRCAELVREFGLDAVLVGNGEEYQELERVRAVALPIVLPVQYPEPPAVDDPDEALAVELDVLRHWNAAPANAARLHEAGVQFAFTSHGLEKRGDFRARVGRAIAKGLPEAAALAAVTTVPARLVGVASQLGTIERGKIANFTVTDGDLFAEGTRVLEVWVDGERFEVRDPRRDGFERLAGDWRVRAGSAEQPAGEWKLAIAGNEWTLRARLVGADGREVPLARLGWQQGELFLQMGPAPAGESLRLRPEKKTLRGTYRRPDGTETPAEAKRPEPSTGGKP